MLIGVAGVVLLLTVEGGGIDKHSERRLEHLTGMLPNTDVTCRG